MASAETGRGEATHTAAPWRIGKDRKPDPNGIGGYLFSLHVYADDENGDGDIDVAWVSCSQDSAQGSYESPRLSVARANARLIAAAPELLSALENVHDFMKSRIGEMDVLDLADFDAARAAIAKATLPALTQGERL